MRLVSGKVNIRYECRPNIVLFKRFVYITTIDLYSFDVIGVSFPAWVILSHSEIPNKLLALSLAASALSRGHYSLNDSIFSSCGAQRSVHRLPNALESWHNRHDNE
jgi:hypothetical protein